MNMIGDATIDTSIAPMRKNKFVKDWWFSADSYNKKL